MQDRGGAARRGMDEGRLRGHPDGEERYAKAILVRVGAAAKRIGWVRGCVMIEPAAPVVPSDDDCRVRPVVRIAAYGIHDRRDPRRATRSATRSRMVGVLRSRYDITDGLQRAILDVA